MNEAYRCLAQDYLDDLKYDAMEQLNKHFNTKISIIDNDAMEKFVSKLVLDPVKYEEYCLYLLEQKNEDFVWDFMLEQYSYLDDYEIKNERLANLFSSFMNAKKEFESKLRNINRFESQRLKLEPIDQYDIFAFAGKLCDTEDSYFSNVINNNSKDNLYFKLTLKDSDQMIGYVGLKCCERLFVCQMFNTYNISYLVFKEFRNRGFVTEALNELIFRLFNGKMRTLINCSLQVYKLLETQVYCKMLRIVADVNNEASNRIAKKLGFTLDGTLNVIEEELQKYNFYYMINDKE